MKTLPLLMAGGLAATTLLAQGVASRPAPPAQTQAAATAPAPTSPVIATPPITFDVLTPIVVDRRDQSGDPRITVVLKNDGPKTQTFRMSAVAIDGNDTAFPVDATVARNEVPRGQPTLVTVSLKARANRNWEQAVPVRGYLVLETGGNPAPPVSREMRITPSQPSSLASRIVWISLVASVIAVMAGILLARGKLFDRIGAASWSDSWGSNVTLGSSILTAFIGLVVFPEYTHYLPKSMYSVFSVAFPGLVGLSPVIFGLIRVPSGESAGRVTYQGYVFGFALAAVFTLWGALGQLGTLAVALLELLETPAFPTTFGNALLITSIALIVGMVVYGAKSVKEIVDVASAPPASRVPDENERNARSLARDGGSSSSTPALEWPLL